MSPRVRLAVLAVASASLLAVAPAAAATAASGCALPNYPTASCTGVPTGTTFTNTVDGDYTVTTAGQVIDAWHIRGALVVKATGVVIKNSQIDDAVVNDDITSSSFTVTDTTVGTATCETGGFPSIDGHDFTATRVLLRGHQDGVDVTGDNVAVTDSYLQPCYLPPSIVGGDGYHSDGVQDQCGAPCTNLRLTHNTIDARAEQLDRHRERELPGDRHREHHRLHRLGAATRLRGSIHSTAAQPHRRHCSAHASQHICTDCTVRVAILPGCAECASEPVAAPGQTVVAERHRRLTPGGHRWFRPGSGRQLLARRVRRFRVGARVGWLAPGRRCPLTSA